MEAHAQAPQKALNKTEVLVYGEDPIEGLTYCSKRRERGRERGRGRKGEGTADQGLKLSLTTFSLLILCHLCV